MSWSEIGIDRLCACLCFVLDLIRKEKGGEGVRLFSSNCPMLLLLKKVSEGVEGLSLLYISNPLQFPYYVFLKRGGRDSE